MSDAIESTVPARIASPMRILIADDNRDTAELTAELIVLSIACETVLAFNGLEALRLAEAQRPDAMILDLHMPGLGGLDVARRVRQHYAADPPYLIALTGEGDAVADLPAIGCNFDRAFAKPLDVDPMIEALARLASGNGRAARARVPIDLGEVFTRAVRQVLPITAAAGLSLAFDYRGPTLIVEDDPVEVQCGLHRLLLGLVDLLQSGVVLFHAEARLEPSSACTLLVSAAGSGQLRSAAEIAAVIERLGLTTTGTPARGGSELPSASGTCPNTGGALHFDGDANEGVLMRAELHFAQALDDSPNRPDGLPGQGAWIVDARAIESAVGQRRLRRLGWWTRAFVSCAEALAATPQAGQAWPAARPTLLIVVEGRAEGMAGARELQRRMPSSSQCVYAAVAGSPTLGSEDGAAGYTLRMLPLSPLELWNLGAMAAREAGSDIVPLDRPSGLPAERPRVLIVDDNEINRIVGTGLIEALGYEVATANDGLDAIDQCRILAPQLVLMDLDMPVLGGVDATVRLRELQRLGGVAPFPIVAATANATATALAACRHAGMDDVLIKPLRLDELREALRRHVTLL